MSSGVLLLDPDDPRHQEFVKRFETLERNVKDNNFLDFFSKYFRQMLISFCANKEREDGAPEEK